MALLRSRIQSRLRQFFYFLFSWNFGFQTVFWGHEGHRSVINTVKLYYTVKFTVRAKELFFSWICFKCTYNVDVQIGRIAVSGHSKTETIQAILLRGGEFTESTRFALVTWRHHTVYDENGIRGGKYRRSSDVDGFTRVSTLVRFLEMTEKLNYRFWNSWNFIIIFLFQKFLEYRRFWKARNFILIFLFQKFLEI